MSTTSINSLSNYIQSVMNTAIQGSGSTTGANSNNLSGINLSSLTAQPDNSQLSPFAQLVSTLQQLQQSDPSKYQQVTQQIATNLKSAAQTAQADGNTTAANTLNQLSTDFTNASQSGQLPNFQDLAQAVGGHHHHHHHAQSASTDSSSDSSPQNGSSTSTSNTLSQMMSQIQAAFQVSGSTSDSLDPMTIISNTLSSAGITSSNT
jgi:hypothetical protein